MRFKRALTTLLGVVLLLIQPVGFGQQHIGPEYPNNLAWCMSRGACVERENVRFTAAPADPENLSHIYPLGLMTGSHVTPVDHQYYFWKSLDVPVEAYPVYSPADGVVVEVAFQAPDYRIAIEHSCDVYTIWIHLEELAGPLAYLDGNVSSIRPTYDRVPVVAGELIAVDGGTNGFDFSAHDARVILPGFVRPESYWSEPWKVHTVDPYSLFDEPVRSALLAKNVRQVEPLGGKIDHDVEGALMGNWFVEGTDGYAGPVDPPLGTGYWTTHFAIAPDAIDPRAVIVSMSDFGDHREQVAIGNLDPHPADVSVETGLVTYELVGWAYVRESTGEHWSGVTRAAYDDIVVEVYPQHVDGTILLQLLDAGRLQMEAFPGLRASQVSGFTSNATIYVR